MENMPYRKNSRGILYFVDISEEASGILRIFLKTGQRIIEAFSMIIKLQNMQLHLETMIMNERYGQSFLNPQIPVHFPNHISHRISVRLPCVCLFILLRLPVRFGDMLSPLLRAQD